MNNLLSWTNPESTTMNEFTIDVGDVVKYETDADLEPSVGTVTEIIKEIDDEVYLVLEEIEEWISPSQVIEVG